MKRKIHFLFYGFVLMLVWGICFLGKGMSDQYTAVMGLSFSFLGTYLLQKEYKFNLDRWDKTAFLCFPVLYVLALYFVLYGNNVFTTKKYNLFQILFYFHLINPLNIALIGLLLGLTIMKDITKPLNIFILSYAIAFYVYFFYPNWTVLWIENRMENFDKISTPYSEDKIVNDTLNISHFSFINPGLDTIRLELDSSKYILLETWSENCMPCIRAMDELPDFYQTLKNRVSVYYLYESDAKEHRSNFNRIFNFESIQDQSHILVDVNQNLYNTLDMRGYPYFLLFNSKGSLVYQKRGYASKKVFTKEVLEAIQ